MNEDRELSRLEEEWKQRFERFTAPEPTREQTLHLLKTIKGVEEAKPVDVRAELEELQAAQTMTARVVNLFLSQWNFQGARSWLFTGIVMLVLTLTISQNMGSGAASFTAWIKWITLLVIAVISYAFRAKNEGNQDIEMLSYYPLVVQMFARFLLVMTLQLAITLPLSFIIMGKMHSLHYFLGSFTPILFFGVIGFASTMWLGQKIGMMLVLFIWLSQLVLEKKVTYISLFQLPSHEHFLLMNVIVLGVSLLILSSVGLKMVRVRKLP